MLDPQLAETFRYLYGVLAVVLSCGFATTLVVRWHVLHPGERWVRIGLIGEHVVIVYGAYVAIDMNFPPAATGLFLTLAMAFTLGGFVVWLADLLMHGDDGPTRLTDR